MNSDLYNVIYKAVKSAVNDMDVDMPENELFKKYLTFVSNVLYLELEGGLDLTDPDYLASQAFNGWCLAVIDEVVNDLPGYTDEDERQMAYHRSVMATQPFSKQHQDDQDFYRYVAEEVIAAYVKYTDEENEVPLEKYDNEEVSL